VHRLHQRRWGVLARQRRHHQSSWSLSNHGALPIIQSKRGVKALAHQSGDGVLIANDRDRAVQLFFHEPVKVILVHVRENCRHDQNRTFNEQTNW